MATYYSIVNGYYNPVGIPTPTVTSAVTYNGTPTTTGGTTDYALNNLTSNEVVSTILLNFYNEFHRAYLRLTADETNITANTNAIAAVVAALAALKTSSLQYNGPVKTGGTPPNPTYSMTTNLALNTILVSIWNEFTAVYTAIAGTSTGVSLTVLDNTINDFVTPFTTGLTNPSNTLLVATIGSGSAIINGRYQAFAGSTANLIATRDNYLYLTIGSPATITVLNVPIADPAPAVPANSIAMWRLRTDGTHVILATDLRNIYPFTTSQIKNLYANNTIPVGAADSSWDDFLLPATTTTGFTIVSDGSKYVEETALFIDEANTRIGIGQNTPTVTGHFNGSIIVANDGGTHAGEISYNAGKFYGHNATTNVIIPQVVGDISNVTLTGAKVGDTLYFDGTVWRNRLPGTSGITTTSAALYAIVATDQKVFGDVGVGTVNIQMPDATANTGREILVAPVGDASVHNLTISSLAGNVHGAPTLVIATANKAVLAVSNGVDWICIYGA